MKSMKDNPGPHEYSLSVRIDLREALSLFSWAPFILYYEMPTLFPMSHWDYWCFYSGSELLSWQGKGGLILT